MPERRPLIAELRDTLLGRPAADRAWSAAVSLVLVLLWHVLLLALADSAVVEAWLDDLAQAARPQNIPSRAAYNYESILPPLGVRNRPDNAMLFALVWTALEGGLALLIFALFARRAGRRAPAQRRRFLRCWWRSCLSATPLAILGAIMLALLHPWPDLFTLAAPAVLGGFPIYLLVAPMLLARRELRRGRPARWRPVCPECGYSLRRATGERCSECGEPFVGSPRVYRRWAMRRLPWDRRRRPGLLFAYIKTSLAILICPCRAARGVGIPDRYGRAVRWAVAHILAAAVICAVFGSRGVFLGRAAEVLEYGGGSLRLMSVDFDPLWIVVWWLECVVCWALALGALPILGVVLSMSLPWRHPVARRASAKWALYGSLPLFALIVVWYGIAAAEQFAAQSTAPVFSWFWDELARLPFALAAVAYGLWWSCGPARQAYVRHDATGVAEAAFFALIYFAAWFTLARLVLPAGPLEAML